MVVVGGGVGGGGEVVVVGGGGGGEVDGGGGEVDAFDVFVVFAVFAVVAVVRVGGTVHVDVDVFFNHDGPIALSYWTNAVEERGGSLETSSETYVHANVFSCWSFLLFMFQVFAKSGSFLS